MDAGVRDTPIVPRLKRRRWLAPPYARKASLRPGDQVVRRAKLSILETVQMNAEELQAAFAKLGVRWAPEYYDPETRSLTVYHHGICTGPNEIVDFHGKGIRKLDFASFGEGEPIYVVHYTRDTFTFPPQVVAARARACLEHGARMKWHRLYNNCDQWATYCVTGRLHSVAVDGIVNRVLGTALNLCVLAGCLGWWRCLFLLAVAAVVAVVCVALLAARLLRARAPSTRALG